MNPTKNIIFALIFSLTFGGGENKLNLKPSASIMPEKIFSNQANYSLSKKYKKIKLHCDGICLYQQMKKRHLKSGFQLNMPLPDLVIFFKGKSHSAKQFKLAVKSSTPNLNPVTGRLEAVYSDQIAYKTFR